MLREMEAQGKVYEVVHVDSPSIKASNNHGAQVTWEEKESILTIEVCGQCQVRGTDMNALTGSSEKGMITSCLGKLEFDLIKKMFSEGSGCLFFSHFYNVLPNCMA